MAQQRRKYGPEFKRDALKLVAERRSVASVGRGLGIDVNTLHGWRARLAENPKRVQSNRVLGAGHPEHRPRLQQAIYINGLRYGGELIGSAETSLAFSYLNEIAAGKEEMASPTGLEPVLPP